MSTETKDKTPIQKAIAAAERQVDGKDELADKVFFKISEGLKSLLPYEKQWAEEIFNAGYKRGEDQTNVINLFEGQVFPDFKTLYSKYEK